MDSEQSIASVGTTYGRVTLSPDADEVAYIEANPDGTPIVIESLSGGRTRYSRSKLQGYWSGSPGLVANGELKSLDWCPVSGSDKLAVTMRGGRGLSGKLLFEFDRGSRSMKLFTSARSPNMFAPNVAWSPSCNEMAYTLADKDGRPTDPLVAFDVGTGKDTELTQLGKDPAWGDTGVAFVRNGNIILERKSGAVRLTTPATTDRHPVIFEQAPGESLAFLRGNDIYLIERIDQIGDDLDFSRTKVTTDRKVTTFDIVD